MVNFTKSKVYFTLCKKKCTFEDVIKTLRMKTNYLLPQKFKTIGIAMLVPTLLMAVLFLFYDFEFPFLDFRVFSIINDPIMGDTEHFKFIEDNITNELIAVFAILSLVFIAFSKRKVEDELVANIRLKSLLGATYINYLVLLFCILFFYNFTFLWVMMFNMFTLLLFFIIHFNFKMIQLNRK